MKIRKGDDVMRVILNDQEVNDNHYEFIGVPMVATKGFVEKFTTE